VPNASLRRALLAIAACSAIGCARARPLSLEGATLAPTVAASGSAAARESTIAPSRDGIDDATWSTLAEADYLALGPRALLDAAAPLFAHRRALGHHVVTLASETISAGFARARPGAPVDGERWVGLVGAAAARSGGRLRFVLLLGDADAELAPPTQYRAKLRYDDGDGDPTPRLGGLLGRGKSSPPPEDDEGAGGFVPAFPTDGPYARASLQGFSRDEAAKAPASRRLAVGRIPARTAEQAARVAAKIVDYETKQPGGAWQRRLSVLAGPPDFGGFIDGVIERTAERMLDEDVSYDFDVRFFFASARSPYAPRLDRMPKHLRDELAQGALIAGYVGHGDATSFDSVDWRGQPWLLGDVEDARALDVRAGSPFFVSLACDNGALDRQDGRASLGVELVLAEHGALAVLAASRESHPYANALYGQAILATFVNGRPRTIGEGVLEAQDRVRVASLGLSSVLVHTDVVALKEEHEALYNLLGDPATRLRYPDALDVTLADPAAAKPGARVKLVLRAKGAATSARVTLETRRATLRGAITGPAALEAMPLAKAADAMDRNAALANDKVVLETTARLERGSGEVELVLPKTPGSYVIKAIAGPTPTSIGHLDLSLAP
jgi:hypothetical protein